MKNAGKFIISLDCELMWGLRHKRTIETYGEKLLGARRVFPKIIKAFEEHEIRATFAIVGFLFASSKEELRLFSPSNRPNYSSANLSPYGDYMKLVGDNEAIDKYHFATELIDILQKYPNHEIASHTFSHYYCLEGDQNIENFRADVSAAISIAKKRGIFFNSIIFPRNQYNKECLKILADLGITAYRGTEESWIYNKTESSILNILQKGLRSVDSYLNLTGNHCYELNMLGYITPFNIPSSRFLRPYSRRLKYLEPFKLRRIIRSMDYAAKNGKIFHLWWHPHNFGINPEENLSFLEKILKHYTDLRKRYNFESCTMKSLSESYLKDISK